MRSYLTILLTLACASAALAIVCTDECARIDCAMADEKECLARGMIGQFEYQPHGGYCGCCSLCVRVLSEGENCIAMILSAAMPSGVRCADGLRCNFESRTCVKKPVI